MCNISLSEKTLKTLLDIGCTGDKFLRISATPDSPETPVINAYIDNQMNPTDDVVLNKGNVRVVSSRSNLNVLDGLTIKFSPELTLIR